jgi:hypothetical protein
MTEPKRTYLVDAEGVYASVAASEVDTYTPLGWEPAPADPIDTDLVWLEHEVHHGKAKFAVAVVPQWEGLGWHPSTPPKPVDTLHDSHLVDPVVADAEQPKTKPASAAKKEQ